MIDFANSPGHLHGIPVRLNPSMTEAGEPVQVKRPWRERLFTTPWRPLATTRTHIPQVPSRNIYRIPGGLVMHPALWGEIKSLISRGEL